MRLKTVSWTAGSTVFVIAVVILVHDSINIHRNSVDDISRTYVTPKGQPIMGTDILLDKHQDLSLPLGKFETEVGNKTNTTDSVGMQFYDVLKDEFEKHFLDIRCRYLGRDHKWHYVLSCTSDDVYKIQADSLSVADIARLKSNKTLIMSGYIMFQPLPYRKRSIEFDKWYKSLMLLDKAD